MANIGAYSRHKMLEEMNTPLFTNKGDGATPLVYSPQEQRDRAKVNLGSALTVGGPGRQTMAAPATATDTATLTVAQVINGTIVGDPTVAATYTMPAVATFAADPAVAALVVGESFDFVIVNVDAALAITLAGGAGYTLTGGAVVAAATSVRFRVRKTADATFTIFRYA